MRSVTALSLALLALLCAAGPPVAAADHVTFGLDWKAEAEYGGYYQAQATGIYARHGLDVTIEQGGPQVNHTQLLIAGRLDALKGKPIMIGADTRAGWWNFLKARFGYTDAQIRPYTFNLQPFMASKGAIQEGFLGSEPFSIKEATGETPVVLLIADAGYDGYASLIGTSDKLIAEKPDLVQRFVDASTEGWYSYLYGDPSPANAAIKKANPEMTDALIAYGRASMKEHGIVDSGDALKDGIGAMTDARWKAFYDEMAAVGLYPRGMDFKKAYTLQFVDKRVGIDAKRQ